MYFGESQDTFWICLCHHDSIHLHFATMPSHGWPLLLSSLTNSLDVLPSQPESLMPSDGMFPSLELYMHNCAHNSAPICPEQITANYCVLRRHVTSLSNYTMHNCVCNSAPCATPATLYWHLPTAAACQASTFSWDTTLTPAHGSCMSQCVYFCFVCAAATL